MSVVAPFVGVWIEICLRLNILKCIPVAPFVGVWIEIVSNEVEILNRKESLPLWECGLKS